MRILLSLALVALSASSLHAQDFARNAWGLAAAPMTYNIKEGREFEVNESNTSLDFGLSYARFFSPSWSGRLEVFLQERDLYTFHSVSGYTWVDDAYYSVEEKTVQTDLVLRADRRFRLGEQGSRFFAGAGLLLAAVYDQTISRPTSSTMAGDPTAGTYLKFGWLADAGVSLGIDDDFGVFASFRIQQDEDAFSRSDDADIVREVAAFGFHVGAEFGF
jgi:hypothetical protein